MITSLVRRIIPPSIINLIDQRPGLRKIIVNIGWLFADDAAAIVVGFLVGAWVARYLEPTQYGVFNYALAVIALFTPLVALGLKDIVIREIVRAPESKDEILGTTFGLQLVGGTLALGSAIIFTLVTRSDDALALWLIAILGSQFVFQAFSVTLGYWFNSQIQAKYLVWANNIALVLYTLVRVGLILSKASLLAFAWVSLGQVVVYAIVVFVLYQRSGQKLSTWQISLVRAGRLLGDSWPLIISGISVMIYQKIGQIMLGNMIGAKELGIYSAALRLSEFWYFVPLAISASVFPAIVHSRKNEGGEVHNKRMQAFFDVMAGIAYSIAIPLALLAPFIVRLIFGQDYNEAGVILRVHIWALLIGSQGTARSRWLLAEDMVGFNVPATVLGALANIAMNFLLIPKYGGLGAAWAVVISQVVSAYLSSILSRRLWPVFAQQSLALLVPFRVFSLKKTLVEILQQSPP